MHALHKPRPVCDSAAHVAAEDKVEGDRICPLALDIINLEVDIRRDPFICELTFSLTSRYCVCLPLGLDRTKVVSDYLTSCQSSSHLRSTYV